MKVLVACDSFKDCLDSASLNMTIAKLWKTSNPDDTCDICAIADGGEGTTDVLVNNQHGKIERVESFGPLMKPQTGTIGWVDKKAIIEVASVSGLQLLTKEDRNPWYTSSYGTGYLIGKALDQGATEIILALGGSATNDAGVGLLQALGGRFIDRKGNEVRQGAQFLLNIAHIDLSVVYNRISNCQFTIATDVTNPLLGVNGATEVFSRQKGANERVVVDLEHAMKHVNSLFLHEKHISLNDYEGGGAAGGIGAIAQGVLKGKLVQGIDLVMSICNLERRIQCADLVITGEGMLDSQTLFGKAPFGVLKIARKYNTSIIAICGSCKLSESEYWNLGFKAVYALDEIAPSKDESIINVTKWLSACVNLISESADYKSK